jgi:hypothetical protein
MMEANIVSLEDVKRDKMLDEAARDPDAVPEFIKARSIADMTETEQDEWLIGIRSRRLEAIRKLETVKQAKTELSALSARHKLEKKLEQVRKAEEKVLASLEKLEELVFQARALSLQLS